MTINYGQVVFIYVSKRRSMQLKKNLSLSYTNFVLNKTMQLLSWHKQLADFKLIIVDGSKYPNIAFNILSQIKEKFPEKKIIVLSQDKSFNYLLFSLLGQKDRILFNIYSRKKSLRKVSLLLET